MSRAAAKPGGWAGMVDDLDRRWITLVLIVWAAYAGYSLYDRWNAISWWSLGDTDDNMRLMQVRGLLNGQGWYDLRQYRLNPPAGFDIHWSRLVDLPIAGLILVFRLFTTDAWAERLACGVAPLLPLSVTLLALAAVVRRLVDRLAWPLAAVILFGAVATMLMFAPERIDHHGWQLAFLMLTLAGLTDPLGGRGGATVGLATAASLSIGLEMLPYGALAGAILTLRWVADAGAQGGEARRLSAYAATLGGGSALGYLAFASYADRVARCDALTPVWLSVMVAAGALLLVMARFGPASRRGRLVLAVVAGAAIAAGFALVFPQCLGRPEQVSDELARNWLDNVKEARPIYRHPFRTALPIAALPIVGLIGAGIATWRTRATPLVVGWATATAFAACAALLLLWQVRAGPAAQMLAVPGAVALGWLLAPVLLNHRSIVVRVVGPVAAFLLVSGLFAGWVLRLIPNDTLIANARARTNVATGECMRTTRLLMLDRYRAATIFTLVDLGPRIITITHHDAVAGPYHRNGSAILDVQHAFTGTPDQAHRIIAAHRARLLLLCPGIAEGTIYSARAPGGFYAQLSADKTFPWLTPLPLPARAPYKLFRVS